MNTLATTTPQPQKFGRAAADAVTVSAGESFVVPRGFVGTWEVVEPTKKTYVIYEAGA